MSTRKSANKAIIDSPTSSDSSSIRSTTAKSSVQAVGSELDSIESPVPDTKRPRRTLIRTPTTLSSSSSNKKKVEESDEVSSPVVGGDVEDDKIVKSTEDTKSEDGKKTDSQAESPARAARKRKVFDKTAIVTRKSAMDLANNTKRVLRCPRRNSTGKFETLDNEPKKRNAGGKKTSASSTPEPPVSLKRKAQNSVKSDDKNEVKRPEKMIKLEPLDGDEVQKTEEEAADQKTTKSTELKEEDKLKLLVGETDSKDDELVEVVEIKQEIEDDSEDVPMEENSQKETEEESEAIEENNTQSSDLNTITTSAEEDKLSDGEIVIAKLFRNDKNVKDNSSSREDKVKSSEDEKALKKLSTVSPTSSASDTNKKIIAKKEDVKEQEDSKFEALERPRRARAKRSFDTPPTPVKKYGRKQPEKISNEDNSDKIKVGKKVPAKSLAAASVVNKSLQTAKNEATEESKIEEDKNITLDVVNGIAEPLTVDTSSTSIATEEKDPPSTSSDKNCEKASSLSPELVSEGVSAISVKQFYKKPEFLENNLGIEKDPKLGGIVQEVEKDKDETEVVEIVLPDKSSDLSIDANVQTIEGSPSCSGDSLKESERLLLEDSTEDDIGNSSANQIECNEEEEIKPVVEEEEENVTTGAIISEEPELPNLKVDEDEKAIVSNSESAENADTLKIICDSTKTTAVDSEKAEKDGKSDTDIKDKTARNKNSTMVETEVGVVADNQVKITKVTSSQGKDETEDGASSSKSEAETNIRTLSSDQILNDIDITESTDVDEGDKNNKADEKGTQEQTSEDNAEEDMKFQTEEDVVMDDIDEQNENKENVSCDATDMKDVQDNIQNCISTPTKIEKSDDEESIEMREKRLQETPETFKQKENHLKNLGLLTHKAAVEAKIEKQRRRKLLQQSTVTAGGAKKNGNGGGGTNGNNSAGDSGRNGGGNGSGLAGNCNKNSQEYTGTLKTVIKLNRPTNGSNNENKRKNIASGSGTNCGGRQSLKMTFQKGRGRSGNIDKDTTQTTGTEDDTYYTIQNESEGGQESEAVTTHGRKSHNRSHTIGVCLSQLTQCSFSVVTNIFTLSIFI